MACERWTVTDNGFRVSFSSNENVLKLGSKKGCKTLWIYQWSVYFKKVTFMVCELCVF